MSSKKFYFFFIIFLFVVFLTAEKDDSERVETKSLKPGGSFANRPRLVRYLRHPSLYSHL